jgi:HlyD family secretion protein
MADMLPSAKPWYKRWLTRNKIIIYVIIILAAGFFVMRSKNNGASQIQTDTVKRMDLKQTVLATGQVTSETDLSLSFQTSGIVSRISTQVGDKVQAGQILATLSQSSQIASLTQAQGALAQAQAAYQKVLDGASNEDVAVTQVALDNAKSSLENTKLQQQVLADNAYSALLNSTPAAIASAGNTGSITATVSGTYTAKDQGQYQIVIVITGNGLKFQYSGLETGSGSVDIAPQPIGTRGLYIQFSSTSVPANNSWTISIPNTQASTYVTNYNAYQSALETQRVALTTAENVMSAAQAALDLKKAKARPADLAAAQAEVLTAQGQVQAAQSNLENTMIRAPAKGTITSVDVKVGELATALKEAIVLQDVDNLHVEANISEANIADLKVNQSAEVTFDALGLDRIFKAQVQQIDPASTVISGVVNYKVTLGLEKLSDIKPGMTANLNILTAEKDGVLAIPSRAVINQDSKKVVRLVTDAKTKAYKEVEVKIGLNADGGLVEVLSGLNEGQEIVTLLKP